MTRILQQCPGIGKEIERFVESKSVGADAWRRTSVLTFDGSKVVKEKVTFERIRQHLQLTYKRHFAYGTIVQLCGARNRRRSASRYKGVAQVTWHDKDSNSSIIQTITGAQPFIGD